MRMRCTVWHILPALACAAALLAKAEPPRCGRLSNGPARGVMCLHCMYPPARAGVDALTDALLHSCRKNAALSFVTDGSWGFDGDIIRAQVAKLTAAGRTVHLHLYIVNGPGQRRWSMRMFKGWSMINPWLLNRALLRKNHPLRRTFVKEVKKLLPIIAAARALGAVVTMSPALEDNFSNSAFTEALSILRRTVPHSYRVQFVRSPCGDCYPGNQTHFPAGVVAELHPAGTDFGLRNSIIANDGFFFLFRAGASSALGGAAHSARTFAFDHVRAQARRASSLGNKYFLWIGKYQGSRMFLDMTPPEKRSYPLPTKQEVEDIAALLR